MVSIYLPENNQYPSLASEACTVDTKEPIALSQIKKEPIAVSHNNEANSNEYNDIIIKREHNFAIAKQEPQNTSTHKASPQQLLHKCKICQFETTDETYLPAHMKTHKQKHNCNSCSYFCGSELKLMRHQKKYHMKLEDLLYYCGDCSFTTLQRIKLVLHRRQEHQRVSVRKKNQACPKCPYRASRSNVLIKHQIKAHRDPFFQCGNCQKLFLDEAEYIDHSVSHLYKFKKTRRGKFNCKLCDFFNKDQTLMIEHNKSVH